MDAITKKLSEGKWSLIIGLSLLILFGLTLTGLEFNPDRKPNPIFGLLLAVILLVGIGFCINSLGIYFHVGKKVAKENEMNRILLQAAPFKFDSDEALLKFANAFFKANPELSASKKAGIRLIGESLPCDQLEFLINWTDNNSITVSEEEANILRNCWRRRFNRTALDIFNEIKEFDPTQISALSFVNWQISYYLRLEGHDADIQSLAEGLITYLRLHNLDRTATTQFITDLDTHPNGAYVSDSKIPIWYKIISQLHLKNKTL